MTITDHEVAKSVYLTIQYPKFCDQVEDPKIRQLIDDPETREVIDKLGHEVTATENASKLIKDSCHTISGDIRRRIMAEEVTKAAVTAANFGATQEAKQTSRSRLPQKPIH